MSYRKLVIDNTEYKYTIGKQFTKVVGVKIFPNSEIGNPCDNKNFIVTPRNVRHAILGKSLPLHVCSHGLTTELSINPYASEIYGKTHHMPKCDQCLQELANDI